jgi:hypothetical protein
MKARGFGRGAFDARSGLDSANEAQSELLRSIQKNVPSFLEELNRNRKSLSEAAALVDFLARWHLKASDRGGYWLATRIGVLVANAQATNDWDSALVNPPPIESLVGRRPSFLELDDQAETLAREFESRQRRTLAAAVQKRVRKVRGRTDDDRLAKDSARILSLLRRRNLTGAEHRELVAELETALDSLGLRLPTPWIAPTYHDAGEPLAPLSAVPTAETLEDFLARAKAHWRVWCALAASLRLKRTTTKYTAEHVDWFVKFQVCGVSYAQIAREANRTGQDDWKTVKRAVRAIADLLRLRLRTPKAGRPCA